MKTPADKRIVFTLYSHPMKNVKHRWKAHLAFNPGSTDDSSAELDVMDGEGAPIEKGTFEFAGQRLAVRNGRSLLRWAISRRASTRPRSGCTARALSPFRAP